jgi:hypothetical protein
MGWLTVALFCLVFIAPAASKSSPECPNGCIIASVLIPNRVCECVVPKCDLGLEAIRKLEEVATQAAAEAVAKGAAPVGPPTAAARAAQLAGMAGQDCDFCSRDSFTYASFEDCYAADTVWKPIGPSIDVASYNDLALSAIRRTDPISSDAVTQTQDDTALVVAQPAGEDTAATAPVTSPIAADTPLADAMPAAAATAEVAATGSEGSTTAADVADVADVAPPTSTAVSNEQVAAANVCPPPALAGCTVSSTNQALYRSS